MPHFYCATMSTPTPAVVEPPLALKRERDENTSVDAPVKKKAKKSSSIKTLKKKKKVPLRVDITIDEMTNMVQKGLVQPKDLTRLATFIENRQSTNKKLARKLKAEAKKEPQGKDNKLLVAYKKIIYGDDYDDKKLIMSHEGQNPENIPVEFYEENKGEVTRWRGLVNLVESRPKKDLFMLKVRNVETSVTTWVSALKLRRRYD